MEEGVGHSNFDKQSLTKQESSGKMYPRTEDTSSESIHLPPYAISIEEFQQTPSQITRYEIGQPIIRDNFINATAYSFLLSRGVPDIQRTFFAWIQAQTGFDYQTTFKNFVEAGTACLTPKEIRTFVTAFKKVPRHKKEIERTESEVRIVNASQKGSPTNLDEEILTRLWNTVNMMGESAGVLLPQEKLVTMAWRDFKQEMTAHYPQRKTVKSLLAENNKG